MAAPAFVSATAHAGNPTTAPSVTLPTTAADDILILVRVNGGATTLAAPGGTYSGGAWSSISSGTWTTGGGDAMWSRCTGNHSGQTVTAATTNSGSLLVIRISGAITTGSPLDTNVAATTLGAVAGGALTGFNTTVADTLVCYVGAVDDNQTASSPTKSGSAMSNLSTATSTGGADSGVWYANSAQASAGATGNFAITNAAGTAEGKRVIAFAIKPPLTGYPAEVMADTPTAYWRLGEDSGTVAQDLSGNGRHGTYSAGCTLNQTGYITGDDGAPDFNGTSGRVTTTYNPWSGAITLEMWFNADTVSTNVCLIGADSHVQLLLVPGDGSPVNLAFFYNGFGAVSWNDVVDVGSWYHLVLTFDPTGNAELFLNGASQGTVAAGAYGGSPGNLQIGARTAGGATWFDGKIDEVAVYSGALSSARIQAHYDAGNPAISVPVGQVTETDTALSITPSKVKAVGLITETQAAQAFSRAKSKAVGLATETDQALPITVVVSGGGIDVAVGQITETDTPQSFSPAKSLALGLTTETEAAQSITPTKARAVGLITETQTAQSFGKAKVKAVGLATETEEALSISPLSAGQVGIATETDQALSITPQKTLAVGLATETDQALAITVVTEGEDGTSSGDLALLHVGN